MHEKDKTWKQRQHGKLKNNLFFFQKFWYNTILTIIKVRKGITQIVTYYNQI